MSPRGQAIDDLRLAIECLPRATRVAMLEGLAANDIIVGAYSNRDGICPMLAAHRAGGRTSFIGFAEAWDRFAERSGATKRARRASERELLILRTHLQASLLAEDAGGDTLAAAIAEHRDLTARSAAQRRAQARRAERALRRTARPGDRDRSQELRRVGGWAWTRIFRRYDDYERALARLEREAQAAPDRTPSPV
ncbi:MAG: hypothetical protein QOG59_1145 [Solirubrobacteraceae bacterium]|jgi:hypothetical protein|nr:hypothetical protein [Solirubrobacteraceae bacterium]